MEFILRNGLTLDDAKGIAPFLRLGADFVGVEVAGYGDYMSMLFPEHILLPDPLKRLDLNPMDTTRGGKGIIVPLAAAIKEQVKVPVACAGSFEPVLGEEFLRQGKLDFRMTRRLVASGRFCERDSERNARRYRPLCRLWLLCSHPPGAINQ